MRNRILIIIALAAICCCCVKSREPRETKSPAPIEPHAPKHNSTDFSIGDINPRPTQRHSYSPEELAYSEGYDDGYEIGYNDGLTGLHYEASYYDTNDYDTKALIEAYISGYSVGYNDGYSVGRQENEKEEEEEEQRRLEEEQRQNYPH